MSEHAGASSAPSIYTIGHSNHSEDVFLDLLRGAGIEVVVDVRSQPYCRYATHFNAEPLRDALAGAGFQYLFLGRELGGRPPGEDFYDPEGHVLYDRVAQAPHFLKGVDRLENGIERYRVTMMCSEENPAVCHRFLLVARVLADRGIAVRHIRGDGAVQTHDELNEQEAGPPVRQKLLFAELEAPAWRSLRSVSPGKGPESSSER